MKRGERPLRLVMVTPRYFPYAGGIETHVYETSRRLAAAGIDVTVLTCDPTGDLPHRECHDGVQVHRVGAWPRGGDYYIAPIIYRLIRDGSWDLVHCQGIHTLVPPLAMASALRAGIPFVVTFHTGGHSSRLRTVARGMQWRLLRPLLARAARLIGVSQFEADLFHTTLQLPRSRFVIIRNGGHLPPPAGVSTVGASSAPLIVSSGRLERYKGHQRVIDALPTVRSMYPDARLLILGSGPYEGRLRARITARGLGDCVEIRAIPAGNREEMAKALAQAELVTLLSDYEAHPVAVMEALALKRPVLVTDTSGLRELAEQGLVRAVSRTSSPARIAAAIVAELRNPLIPGDVQLPTWERCVEDLLRVYQQALEGRVCEF